MPGKLSRRLSSQDATFLYYERPSAPLHIGSLGIYEGRIPFARFFDHLDARLPQIPRYRQRLAFVPFGLSHPTWEDDPDFDLENHLRHHTLVPPGNDDQLRALTAELFAQPLDRNRPLWEMYVIDGLEDDRSAILSKVHHTMVDGISGIELLMTILDLSPEPAPAQDAGPWDPGPLPDSAARLAHAFWDRLGEDTRLLQEFQEGLINPSLPLKRAQDVMRATNMATPWISSPPPRTPFAGTLGQQRRLAFSEMSFVEIREIRTSLGGTVNDVVLAVLTGALRRYMVEHDCPVEGVDIRVAIPVNVRLEDEQREMGNRISSMLAALPVGEADPVARLNTIGERVAALKEGNQAGGFELLARMSAPAPAPFHMLAGQTAGGNPLVNLVCTNVPGPMIPLYSVGHLMLDHYPLVPLSFDMGLGVGVTSYNQRLYFGLMVDPKIVSDIDTLKRCLDDAFLELRSAAGVPASDLEPFGAPSTNGAGTAQAPSAVQQES